MSNIIQIEAVEAGVSGPVKVQLELDKEVLPTDEGGPQIPKRFLWIPYDQTLDENDRGFKRKFAKPLDLFKKGKIDECKAEIVATLKRISTLDYFWRIQLRLLRLAAARCWDVAFLVLNDAQEAFQKAKDEEKLTEREIEAIDSQVDTYEAWKREDTFAEIERRRFISRDATDEERQTNTILDQDTAKAFLGGNLELSRELALERVLRKMRFYPDSEGHQGWNPPVQN